MAMYGAAAILTLPLAAGAIDHPVDQAILGIPIPVPDIRYFISGGLCAALSHGVTTPIDVVKTRIQSEPEVFNEGLLSATRTIVAQNGVGALLGGLGPTVVGYGSEGAIKFGLYESLKPVFSQFLPADDVAVAYLAASVIAGAAASLLLCPMEHTRIRLVTEPTFAKGLIDGLPRIVEEEGWEGVFSGFPAMLSKQVPYTMTKQVSFDVFAGMLYSAAASLNLAAASVKLQVEIGAAFLASILSCISSQPGDVILTDTYKLKTVEQSDFRQVVSSIYNEQGLGGYFVGLTARFLQVGTIITSQLVLYDIVKQLLGLPATGSH
jgi:solute carrier family 25 phosphate transporter 3